MSSTIRNGLARTIQHTGNMLMVADGNRERAREREINRTREELRNEVLLRVKAENEVSDLRKKCVELEERASESEALLLYWANSSKAYMETLDFLQKNWNPADAAPSVSEKEKSDIIDAKIHEGFLKANAAPKEEQEAYRRRKDAAQLANIRQARGKQRDPSAS